MEKSDQHKILFVCMGNICRSPSAEGILVNKVKTESIDKKFIIDSCGTHGYHEGQGPDPRSIEVALLRGICLLYTSPSPRDGLLSRMPS